MVIIHEAAGGVVAVFHIGIPIMIKPVKNILHFYHYIYGFLDFFDFDGSDDTPIFAEVFKISKLWLLKKMLLV